ncbi:flagellar protein FlgN [Gracilibacillus salitolerans]|uniref:Flagellar protein FlgN n=1 Tax=Gracilibacillus salitolerans TaxID=2663022 RepID=A0A5Q2TIS8_9BACI|nr:flagellar protein FlgN [Gracilibacillus salitolerans]QGH34047.1 flagellar protein FlgN [Gracilibacillus salitolerans]
MSVQSIIQHLNKLIELHDSLLHVSKQKTEVLKEGNTDVLQKLLIKEQKHVQAINQIEQKRIDAVTSWATEQKLEPTAVTVSTIIEDYTTGADQQQLKEVTLQLAEQLVELRRQEDLNKQLTQQSLQFVQLSLDMMQPSIKNMNYGNTKHQSKPSAPRRSAFDSKA